MASQQKHRELLDFAKPIKMLEFIDVETNKHLLDEAKTNIQNYHACEIDSGRRRRRSPLSISQAW